MNVRAISQYISRTRVHKESVRESAFFKYKKVGPETLRGEEKKREREREKEKIFLLSLAATVVCQVSFECFMFE